MLRSSTVVRKSPSQFTAPYFRHKVTLDQDGLAPLPSEHTFRYVGSGKKITVGDHHIRGEIVKQQKDIMQDVANNIDFGDMYYDMIEYMRIPTSRSFRLKQREAHLLIQDWYVDPASNPFFKGLNKQEIEALMFIARDTYYADQKAFTYHDIHRPLSESIFTTDYPVVFNDNPQKANNTRKSYQSLQYSSEVKYDASKLVTNQRNNQNLYNNIETNSPTISLVNKSLSDRMVALEHLAEQERLAQANFNVVGKILSASSTIVAGKDTSDLFSNSAIDEDSNIVVINQIRNEVNEKTREIEESVDISSFFARIKEKADYEKALREMSKVSLEEQREKTSKQSSKTIPLNKKTIAKLAELLSQETIAVTKDQLVKIRSTNANISKQNRFSAYTTEDSLMSSQSLDHARGTDADSHSYVIRLKDYFNIGVTFDVDTVKTFLLPGDVISDPDNKRGIVITKADRSKIIFGRDGVVERIYIISQNDFENLFKYSSTSYQVNSKGHIIIIVNLHHDSEDTEVTDHGQLTKEAKMEKDMIHVRNIFSNRYSPDQAYNYIDLHSSSLVDLISPSFDMASVNQVLDPTAESVDIQSLQFEEDIQSLSKQNNISNWIDKKIKQKRFSAHQAAMKINFEKYVKLNNEDFDKFFNLLLILTVNDASLYLSQDSSDIDKAYVSDNIEYYINSVYKYIDSKLKGETKNELMKSYLSILKELQVDKPRVLSQIYHSTGFPSSNKPLDKYNLDDLKSMEGIIVDGEYDSNPLRTVVNDIKNQKASRYLAYDDELTVQSENQINLIHGSRDILSKKLDLLDEKIPVNLYQHTNLSQRFPVDLLENTILGSSVKENPQSFEDLIHNPHSELSFEQLPVSDAISKLHDSKKSSHVYQKPDRFLKYYDYSDDKISTLRNLSKLDISPIDQQHDLDSIINSENMKLSFKTSSTEVVTEDDSVYMITDSLTNRPDDVDYVDFDYLAKTTSQNPTSQDETTQDETTTPSEEIPTSTILDTDPIDLVTDEIDNSEKMSGNIDSDVDGDLDIDPDILSFEDYDFDTDKNSVTESSTLTTNDTMTATSTVSTPTQSHSDSLPISSNSVSTQKSPTQESITPNTVQFNRNNPEKFILHKKNYSLGSSANAISWMWSSNPDLYGVLSKRYSNILDLHDTVKNKINPSDKTERAKWSLFSFYEHFLKNDTSPTDKNKNMDKSSIKMLNNEIKQLVYEKNTTYLMTSILSQLIIDHVPSSPIPVRKVEHEDDHILSQTFDMILDNLTPHFLFSGERMDSLVLSYNAACKSILYHKHISTQVNQLKIKFGLEYEEKMSSNNHDDIQFMYTDKNQYIESQIRKSYSIITQSFSYSPMTDEDIKLLFSKFDLDNLTKTPLKSNSNRPSPSLSYIDKKIASRVYSHKDLFVDEAMFNSSLLHNYFHNAFSNLVAVTKWSDRNINSIYQLKYPVLKRLGLLSKSQSNSLLKNVAARAQKHSSKVQTSTPSSMKRTTNLAPVQFTSTTIKNKPKVHVSSPVLSILSANSKSTVQPATILPDNRLVNNSSIPTINNISNTTSEIDASLSFEDVVEEIDDDEAFVVEKRKKNAMLKQEKSINKDMIRTITRIERTINDNKNTKKDGESKSKSKSDNKGQSKNQSKSKNATKTSKSSQPPQSNTTRSFATYPNTNSNTDYLTYITDYLNHPPSDPNPTLSTPSNSDLYFPHLSHLSRESREFMSFPLSSSHSHNSSSMFTSSISRTNPNLHRDRLRAVRLPGTMHCLRRGLHQEVTSSSSNSSYSPVSGLVLDDTVDIAILVDNDIDLDDDVDTSNLSTHSNISNESNIFSKSSILPTNVLTPSSSSSSPFITHLTNICDSLDSPEALHHLLYLMPEHLYTNANRTHWMGILQEVKQLLSNDEYEKAIILITHHQRRSNNPDNGNDNPSSSTTSSSQLNSESESNTIVESCDAQISSIDPGCLLCYDELVKYILEHDTYRGEHEVWSVIENLQNIGLSGTIRMYNLLLQHYFTQGDSLAFRHVMLHLLNPSSISSLTPFPNQQTYHLMLNFLNHDFLTLSEDKKHSQVGVYQEEVNSILTHMTNHGVNMNTQLHNHHLRFISNIHFFSHSPSDLNAHLSLLNSIVSSVSEMAAANDHTQILKSQLSEFYSLHSTALNSTLNIPLNKAIHADFNNLQVRYLMKDVLSQCGRIDIWSWLSDTAPSTGSLHVIMNVVDRMFNEIRSQVDIAIANTNTIGSTLNTSSLVTPGTLEHMQSLYDNSITTVQHYHPLISLLLRLQTSLFSLVLNPAHSPSPSIIQSTLTSVGWYLSTYNDRTYPLEACARDILIQLRQIQTQLKTEVPSDDELVHNPYFNISIPDSLIDLIDELHLTHSSIHFTPLSLITPNVYISKKKAKDSVVNLIVDPITNISSFSSLCAQTGLSISKSKSKKDVFFLCDEAGLYQLPTLNNTQVTSTLSPISLLTDKPSIDHLLTPFSSLYSTLDNIFSFSQPSNFPLELDPFSLYNENNWENKNSYQNILLNGVGVEDGNDKSGKFLRLLIRQLQVSISINNSSDPKYTIDHVISLLSRVSSDNVKSSSNSSCINIDDGEDRIAINYSREWNPNKIEQVVCSVIGSLIRRTQMTINSLHSTDNPQLTVIIEQNLREMAAILTIAGQGQIIASIQTSSSTSSPSNNTDTLLHSLTHHLHVSKTTIPSYNKKSFNTQVFTSVLQGLSSLQQSLSQYTHTQARQKMMIDEQKKYQQVLVSDKSRLRELKEYYLSYVRKSSSQFSSEDINQDTLINPHTERDLLHLCQIGEVSARDVLLFSHMLQLKRKGRAKRLFGVGSLLYRQVCEDVNAAKQRLFEHWRISAFPSTDFGDINLCGTPSSIPPFEWTETTVLTPLSIANIFFGHVNFSQDSVEDSLTLPSSLSIYTDALTTAGLDDVLLSLYGMQVYDYTHTPVPDRSPLSIFNHIPHHPYSAHLSHVLNWNALLDFSLQTLNKTPSSITITSQPSITLDDYRGLLNLLYQSNSKVSTTVANSILHVYLEDVLPYLLSESSLENPSVWSDDSIHQTIMNIFISNKLHSLSLAFAEVLIAVSPTRSLSNTLYDTIVKSLSPSIISLFHEERNNTSISTSTSIPPSTSTDLAVGLLRITRFYLEGSVFTSTPVSLHSVRLAISAAIRVGMIEPAVTLASHLSLPPSTPDSIGKKLVAAGGSGIDLVDDIRSFNKYLKEANIPITTENESILNHMNDLSQVTIPHKHASYTQAMIEYNRFNILRPNYYSDYQDHLLNKIPEVHQNPNQNPQTNPNSRSDSSPQLHLISGELWATIANETLIMLSQGHLPTVTHYRLKEIDEKIWNCLGDGLTTNSYREIASLFDEIQSPYSPHNNDFLVDRNTLSSHTLNTQHLSPDAINKVILWVSWCWRQSVLKGIGVSPKCISIKDWLSVHSIAELHSLQPNQIHSSLWGGVNHLILPYNDYKQYGSTTIHEYLQSTNSLVEHETNISIPLPDFISPSPLPLPLAKSHSIYGHQCISRMLEVCEALPPITNVKTLLIYSKYFADWRNREAQKVIIPDNYSILNSLNKLYTKGLKKVDMSMIYKLLFFSPLTTTPPQLAPIAQFVIAPPKQFHSGEVVSCDKDITDLKLNQTTDKQKDVYKNIHLFDKLLDSHVNTSKDKTITNACHLHTPSLDMLVNVLDVVEIENLSFQDSLHILQICLNTIKELDVLYGQLGLYSSLLHLNFRDMTTSPLSTSALMRSEVLYMSEIYKITTSSRQNLFNKILKILHRFTSYMPQEWNYDGKGFSDKNNHSKHKDNFICPTTPNPTSHLPLDQVLCVMPPSNQNLFSRDHLTLIKNQLHGSVGDSRIVHGFNISQIIQIQLQYASIIHEIENIKEKTQKHNSYFGKNTIDRFQQFFYYTFQPNNLKSFYQSVNDSEKTIKVMNRKTT